MAGYSGTPLARKLGITGRSQVLVTNPPDGFSTELPVEPFERLDGSPFDVIVAFGISREDMTADLARLIENLSVSGGLWLAWPKRASKIATDLSDSVVRAEGLASGLVDNKVCAIDDMWSALRFVRRLKDR